MEDKLINRNHWISPLLELLHHLVVWMLSIYLLIDIVSGFFVIQLGIDIKVSLLFKTLLFLILITLIARYKFKYFLLLFFSILLFSIAPVVELFRLPEIFFFISDFGYIIKILMPVTVFLYLRIIHEYAPVYTEKWIRIALWSNFYCLLFNLFLGALGFGRASYELPGQESVGSNGYIYAVNELGPTFIVLFGFMLHIIWNNYKKYYVFFAVLTLLCGVLVATKTAMLSAFLLIFLIPLFNERNLFYRLTWLKIKLFVPAMVMLSLLVFYIIEFLEVLGLYDKMMWVFSQKGVLGLLWSGRNEYTAKLFDVYIYHSTLFQQFFGQGSGGVAEHLTIKYSAEVDSVDTLVWFGMLGLLFCLSVNFYFIRKAASFLLDSNSKMAPCVLLINILILALSQLSGHVWMSGTLGISLGLINALLLIEQKKEVEFK
ncbi:MAG: hypothetical protein ACI9LM_003501 [Alteromonadaceae bacterium]|jgi:hypothetical protein